MDQQPEQSTNQTPPPVTQTAQLPEAQTTASVSQPPPITTESGQSIPPVDKNPKRQLMLVSGIVVIVIFILGSVFYVKGVADKTKRLDSYITPSLNIPQTKANIQPTVSDISSEEIETGKVDTGNPETDLLELDADLNSLGN